MNGVEAVEMIWISMLYLLMLDDLADGKDYASLKREAEDRSVWRIRQ